MNWDDFQRQQGASLANDGIPLLYGNLKAEYQAALEQAVFMDRSHEGRMESRGRDRLSLLHRISTNDLLNMLQGEGQPTILTNPNGRILDRLMVYNRGESALITTEAGRGQAVLRYLQRQVFFNDDFQIGDLSASTRLFVLHGPSAEYIVKRLDSRERLSQPENHDKEQYRSFALSIEDIETQIVERKGLSGGHWAVIVPTEGAETVWQAILEAGKTDGMIPAGSLIYNMLRIRAGMPGAGHELSSDYIPLEAGLWDEVNFDKGCYTGQEIIARMESRNRLAKTLVRLRLSHMVEAPASLYHEGKAVGALTSSVTTPENEILGLGFVKLDWAIPEQSSARAKQAHRRRL